MLTVQYAKAYPSVRINAVDGPTGGFFDARGSIPW
jgi:hypothetical protein